MNAYTTRSFASKLFRNSLIALLMISVASVFACTKRPVLTGNDDSDLKPVEVKETEPKKITRADDKLRKPKSWESSGRERVTKVTKAKPKKDISWETGASKTSPVERGLSEAKAESKRSLTDGAGGPTSGFMSPPSAAAPLGFGSSVAKGMPGPTGVGKRMDRSPLNEQASSGILTAGSFDDADDIKVFQRFWEGSELSSSNVGGFSKNNWCNVLKKADNRRHSALQLAFVVDTTGSMGDELEYLKNEFESIVSQVNKSYPGVKKEYAFIVYRDQGDEYVTRGLNFTAEANDVQEFIARQSANGGGDYPEAVHEAMDEAYSRLDWNSNADSARMIFLIADAPAHMNEMQNTFKAVEKLADAGINVFPVAASGVMDTAEAMMRATALMTGGKYIFLTDDSGVGLPHAAPKHPCYEVEKLKDIMVREIKDRIAGSRSFPVASSIIRHGGDRSTGLCRTNRKVVGQW
jgi:Mg-chelatase subunit ChlD